MSSRDFMLGSTEDWEYVEKDESQISVADTPLILLVRGELFNDISPRYRCLRSDEEKRLDADTGLTGVETALQKYGPVGLE
jgi:hypothetical protein